MSQKINIEGTFEPKGGRQGYFRADRWMKGSFVPIQILEGHFRPFSALYIQNLLVLIQHSQNFLQSSYQLFKVVAYFFYNSATLLDGQICHNT